ncbi:MAG: OstA-like protein, partial [Bacteroidota bacterium]
RFRQETTFMEADRVTYYTERGDVIFRGNVRFTDEGDTLTAARVFYNEFTKIGRAEEDVELRDGEVVVRAPTGVYYYTEEKRITFDDGVTLVDSLSILTSLRGEYFTEAKRAEFFENVQLYEARSYLESDSITYFRETRISEAFGNVFAARRGGGGDVAADDSTTITWLFGDHAFSDETAGRSEFFGDPLLLQFRTDSLGVTDTLIVQAQRLTSVQSDSTQHLDAVGNVEVWQETLTAVGDSLTVDRIDVDSTLTQDRLALFGNPLAWADASQVSGDTLRFVQGTDHPDSLYARHNTFIVQEDTTLDRLQQLKGEHLVGVFRSDSTRQFVVGPQAEAIRYLEAEEGGPGDAVQMSADVLTFWVRGEVLERILGERGIQGTLYPSDQIPQPFQLGGFRWVPERRPSKAALLDRPRVQEWLLKGPMVPKVPDAPPAEITPPDG